MSAFSQTTRIQEDNLLKVGFFDNLFQCIYILVSHLNEFCSTCAYFGFILFRFSLAILTEANSQQFLGVELLAIDDFNLIIFTLSKFHFNCLLLKKLDFILSFTKRWFLEHERTKTRSKLKRQNKGICFESNFLPNGRGLRLCKFSQMKKIHSLKLLICCLFQTFVCLLWRIIYVKS